jgi:hypothetical protein
MRRTLASLHIRGAALSAWPANRTKLKLNGAPSDPNSAQTAFPEVPIMTLIGAPSLLLDWNREIKASAIP